MSLTVSPRSAGFRSSVVVPALIAVAYLALSWSSYSPALFGRMHDDSLYFSAAKAIAEGRGSILPSLPGEPDQTKYPPLYPALLSLVWRAAPDFPENLAWAWRLNLLFGVLMIPAAVAALRGVGCGGRETALLTALFALHPTTIALSNDVLSDIPFTAFALAAVAAGDRALRNPAAHPGPAFDRRLWALAVGLVWLAVGLRTAGVAIAAGLAAAALLRRRFLAAAVALTALSPPLVKALAGAAGAAGNTAAARNGFEQTWLYYTSYAGFWRFSAPDFDAVWAQLNFNLVELLKHPAVACFLLPVQGFVSPLAQVVSISLSAAVLHGVWARAQGRGWSVWHLSALAFIPIVLLWNFTLMDRFWLPFAPLLLAGASFELRSLAAALRTTMRSGLDQRIAGALLASLIAGLLLYGGLRYAWQARRESAARLEARLEAGDAKHEAYRWLASHADGRPVIVYEDAHAYLHSGVQGMRPLQVSPQSFYQQSREVFERDAARLGDAAAALGASFWVVAPDDYALESQMDELREATRLLLADEPVVFASGDGSVRIHELAAAGGEQQRLTDAK